MIHSNGATRTRRQEDDLHLAAWRGCESQHVPSNGFHEQVKSASRSAKMISCGLRRAKRVEASCEKQLISEKDQRSATALRDFSQTAM